MFERVFAVRQISIPGGVFGFLMCVVVPNARMQWSYRVGKYAGRSPAYAARYIDIPHYVRLESNIFPRI